MRSFPSKLGLFASSLSGRFVDEGLVDVGNDTSSGNGGLDKGIQFFVTTNGELKMSWCNTLHLQILTGVSSQFQNLGGEVLEDGRSVNSCGGTDTVSVVNRVLQETVHTTNGELKSSLGRSRLGRLLGGWGLSTLSSLTAFSSFARLRRDGRMTRDVFVSIWSVAMMNAMQYTRLRCTSRYDSDGCRVFGGQTMDWTATTTAGLRPLRSYFHRLKTPWSLICNQQCYQPPLPSLSIIVLP